MIRERAKELEKIPDVPMKPGVKRPPGTTWHHSEIDGRMELVPFGIHNSINHQGGRAPGGWAHAKR